MKKPAAQIPVPVVVLLAVVCAAPILGAETVPAPETTTDPETSLVPSCITRLLGVAPSYQPPVVVVFSNVSTLQFKANHSRASAGKGAGRILWNLIAGVVNVGGVLAGGQYAGVPFASNPDTRNEALPEAWQLSRPNRGFMDRFWQSLTERAAAATWADVRIAHDATDVVDHAIAETSGRDVAVAVLDFVLSGETQSGPLRFVVSAQVLTLHGGDPWSKARAKHAITAISDAVAIPLELRPDSDVASPFAEGGALDTAIGNTADDFAQLLHVAVVDAVRSPDDHTLLQQTAPAVSRAASICSQCERGDRVLCERPGRLWYRRARNPGTLMSVPN